MATQKDVAKLANVSFITVSRVINNKGNIKEETRQRVLKAIKELNYHPNILARGLNQNKIYSIGVTTSLTSSNIHVATSPYFHGLLEGIESSLMKHKYDLVISTRRGEKNINDYFRLYYERKVDGIILICTYLNEKYAEEMISHNIPCVVIGDSVSSDNIIYIDTDNLQGGREVTEKLIQFGHEKIGFVQITEQNRNIEDRYRGFTSTLKEHGLNLRDEYIFKVQVDEEEKAGRQVIRMINLMPDPPTAIIAPTDFIALGMIKEAQNVGIQVPQDLSIIGFDAMEIGRIIQPTLFSVSQPLLTMGYTAAEKLINLIENPQIDNKSQIFPMKLVLGDSIAPLFPST